MTTESNRQIVAAIFDELARGNGKPFIDAMADDFRWTIKGRTRWSRTYRGKQAVRRELLAPLFGQFAGTYTNRANRILCEGDVVTKSGKLYCNSYCYVVEMADERSQSLTEYLDTALVEEVLEPPQST